MDAQTVRRYRPWRMTAPLFSAEPSSPWLWESMLTITLVLVSLNVLLIVLVHGRRIRQYVRGGRERRFQARVEAVLAKLDAPTSFRDRLWLRWQLAGFDELERPLAAVALIERLRPAAPEERRQMLEVLREVGAVELLVRSTRSRIPWRRALAVRTLGWAGAEETVPLLIGRIGDRSRYVREAAVRALGRIGDPQVLPLLGELFRAPRPRPARHRLRRARLVRLCGRADVRGRAPFRARVGTGCVLLRRRGGLRARTGACGAVAAACRPGGAGAGCRRGSARAGRRRHAAGRSRTSLPRRGCDGAGRGNRARSASTTTRRRSSWR